MSKKILSLAFVTLLLFSCKENNAEPTQTENTTPVTEAVQPEVQIEQNMQTDNTATQNQVEVQQTPAAPANTGPFIQQQQQTPQTTGQTAPGFSGKPNPPHGQPGHRCDIQVGAVLP